MLISRGFHWAPVPEQIDTSQPTEIGRSPGIKLPETTAAICRAFGSPIAALVQRNASRRNPALCSEEHIGACDQALLYRPNRFRYRRYLMAEPPRILCGEPRATAPTIAGLGGRS